MLLSFVISLVVSLAENKSGWFKFGTIVSAGEIAAWRVKLVALPVAVAILWAGTRIVRSIRQDRDRFNGLRAARLGITAAAVVTILIATLISVTIPERFRQRQYAIEAGQNARLYTIHRALMQYSEVHGTLPPQEDLIKALSALPDPDGLIAEALRGLDLARGELAEALVFDERAYRRVAIHRSPHYEALVLCWKSGWACCP